MTTTRDIAARFDELAREEKWFDIQDELFAENVRSIEPEGAPYLKNAEGKEAVRKKGEDWVKRVEGFHGATTTPSVVGGNYFSVGRWVDITVAGLGRIQMDEIMLYEVQNGRIVTEQFFYQIQDFNTSILVDQSPRQVFLSVTNPRRWWSEEIEGPTERLNDEFTYHYADTHRCKMKLTEVVPDERVVWQVMENYFNFTTDKHEWAGTKIVFDISQEGGKTLLRFTHVGLTPAYECYDVCRKAWSTYVQKSLFNFITTGEGKPNPKE